MNASAVRVKWQAPAPELRHGQIRGYQVHYARINYGEPQGQPFVKDILIEESQVISFVVCLLYYQIIKIEIWIPFKHHSFDESFANP